IYGLEPWKASGCIRFAKSNRINFNQSSRYKEGNINGKGKGFLQTHARDPLYPECYRHDSLRPEPG
ncbi:hypothetical protein, partial [Klebsiella variicola]|uniref:hypothetical protein n=2 Tax=Klebsiella pneumoniae complex TaxID=3390273 RepID=UPI001C6F8A45